MAKYARIIDGFVSEQPVDLAEFLPSDIFPEEIAAQFVPCGDEVQEGWTYSNGVFSAPQNTPNPIVLDDLKDGLKRQIDIDAENERLKYITPGAGQALTYQNKAEEARRYLSEGSDKDPSEYPLLASEIGITGQTLDDVAQSVFAAFSQWRTIGAAIEATRLQAKASVSQATSEAAARGVVDGVSWPVF